MTQNCWDFRGCGREPGGVKVDERGVCPAAASPEADGFCDGTNGGRACAYIVGTYCSEKPPSTLEEKERECSQCDFYRLLKREHGVQMSFLHFTEHLAKRAS